MNDTGLEEHTENESTYVDPAHFLKSFFVVTFHYVTLFMGLAMSMLLIAKLRFPEIFRLWTLPEDKRDEFHDAWDFKPEILFPDEMGIWLIVASIALSLFIGLQVAFWAPFSKAGHGIFLAVLSLVSFLQIMITQPQIPKWILAGMLIASPICIVFASRVGDCWFSKPVTGDSDSSSDTFDMPPV